MATATLGGENMEVQTSLDRLLRFWCECFGKVGIVPDLKGISPPARHDFGKCGLVLVPKDLRLEYVTQIYNDAAKKVLGKHRVVIRGGFDKVDRWTNVNIKRWTNVRSPDGQTYFGIVRPNGLPEEEFAGKSANELDAIGFQGTTVLENLLIHALRMAAGGSRVTEHDKYPRGVICTGTRNGDGEVARVVYQPVNDRLEVVWDLPDESVLGACPQRLLDSSLTPSLAAA